MGNGERNLPSSQVLGLAGKEDSQGLLQLTGHRGSPSQRDPAGLSCLTAQLQQSSGRPCCTAHGKTMKKLCHWALLPSEGPTTSAKPQPCCIFASQDATKHNPIFRNPQGIWTVTLPAYSYFRKPAQKTGFHTWSAQTPEADTCRLVLVLSLQEFQEGGSEVSWRGEDAWALV